MGKEIGGSKSCGRWGGKGREERKVEVEERFRDWGYFTEGLNGVARRVLKNGLGREKEIEKRRAEARKSNQRKSCI